MQMGIFLVWSLVLVYLLQSEFFGPMIRKASGPLTVFIGFPVTIAFFAYLAEYLFNLDRTKSEEDME
jgi:hypothetical protein